MNLQVHGGRDGFNFSPGSVVDFVSLGRWVREVFSFCVFIIITSSLLRMKIILFYLRREKR